MKLRSNEYYYCNGKTFKNKQQAMIEKNRTGMNISYFDINTRKNSSTLWLLRKKDI